jgi:nucleoside-diphosphate-sugar epimerase
MACFAGATGYIGSLVVEQLLRTTSVKGIYLPMFFPLIHNNSYTIVLLLLQEPLATLAPW